MATLTALPAIAAGPINTPSVLDATHAAVKSLRAAAAAGIAAHTRRAFAQAALHVADVRLTELVDRDAGTYSDEQADLHLLAWHLHDTIKELV